LELAALQDQEDLWQMRPQTSVNIYQDIVRKTLQMTLFKTDCANASRNKI